MEQPERTNEMSGVYASQCVELARELGLPSINLWAKMQVTEGWQKKFLRLVVVPNHYAYSIRLSSWEIFVAFCLLN